jgi:hypothetical protein
MLIPAQNSNKTNYKIQNYFANRQIKEDVKCNNMFEKNQKKSKHQIFVKKKLGLSFKFDPNSLGPNLKLRSNYECTF